MIITLINDMRAEAELSPEELSSLGVSFEQLDYGDIETRRALWVILDEIRKSGASIDFSGRLLIEAAMKKNGSVLICFTGLSPAGKDEKSVKQLVKSRGVPLVLETAGIEALYSAAAACRKRRECSLYEKDGKYRLVITPGAHERAELASELGEFGETLPDPLLETARCEEQWRLLARDNALELLISVD